MMCKTSPIGARHLCSPCEHTLPVIEHACKHCGIPLYTKQRLTCGACQAQAPVYHQLFALYHYTHPINGWIHQFKFHQNFTQGRLFSEQMIHAIKTTWYDEKPLPTLLIPVPLANSRLRNRGFNQAIELAKPIAKHFSGISLETKLCQRVIKTKPQSSLHSNERQKNIKNAFSVTGSLRDAHIAIIDDVVTTGGTVSELSLACKKKGARQIDIWCIARTSKQQ